MGAWRREPVSRCPHSRYAMNTAAITVIAGPARLYVARNTRNISTTQKILSQAAGVPPRSWISW